MNKFAIVGIGGKQVRVEVGDIITTEKIGGEPGTQVRLKRIFLTEAEVGEPLVEKAFVSAEILKTEKAPKVRVFKMKSRKRMRSERGHRQLKTTLKILAIEGLG